MQPPKLKLGAPVGIALEDFRAALDQLRTLIYMQRQWLRDTREIYSETDADALTQLESVT